MDSDTAPRAGRRIVMWNPPLIEERTQRRRSPLSEGAELLADLVSEGMRTICFLRSRKGIELIQRFARMRLEDRGQTDLADRIAPYRAGYTPFQRREIERRLAEGELLGVVATDALELGIDIGELDASICVTFPGTVASLRQMWGEGGRAHRGDWPSTSPATTHSTSSSAAIPMSSSTARSRQRSSITRTSASRAATCSPRPMRRRWGRASAAGRG